MRVVLGLRGIQISPSADQSKASGLKKAALALACGCLLVAAPVTSTLAAEESAKPAGQEVAKPAGQAVAKVKKAGLSQEAVKAHREKIKAIQEALVQAGYKIKADGLLGKQTRTAVRKFQKSKGLRVDGRVGPQTLKALGLG